MTGPSPGEGSPNEQWAGALVDELARAGLRQVVVAPGSRSTPVVLAAAAHPALELVVAIDERVAGFLALGVGKATGRPAAVITTSGTAVANLLPAVVEAAQSDTPLLLLTADRPARLQDADANQTIDQHRIFGRYPRMFRELAPEAPTAANLRALRSVACRALAAALGDPAGPVHLNLPFDKPLEPEGGPPSQAEEGRPDGAPFTRIHPARLAPDAKTAAGLVRRLRGARRPLLVAGPIHRPWEAGPALRRFAADTGIPLLADALSGARYPASEGDLEGDGPGDAGRLVLGGYDAILRDDQTRARLRPDLVVRFGAAPTSAALLEWLGQMPGVPQVVVDGGSRWKDHLAVATEMIPSDPVLLFEALPEIRVRMEHAWSEGWVRAEAAVRAMVGRPERAELFEGGVVGAVARRLTPEDLLFIGSSMPVRDLDAFAPHRADALTVVGNRGASGIDGSLSTAAGASLATGRRVVAVVGDLAFLHDQGGLALLGEPGIRVLVVVLNNDGGGIFHHLPIREFEPTFTRFFATPHGRDLSRVTAVSDLPHRSLDTRRPTGEGEGHREAAGADALRAALDWALALDGSGVLEVRTDRRSNPTLREMALRRAAEAVRSELEGR